MVDEAENGVYSKITPASKTLLMEWMKTASDLVDTRPITIKKSFEVPGIIDSNDLRKDSAYTEIKDVMTDVFGEVHMGYI